MKNGCGKVRRRPKITDPDKVKVKPCKVIAWGHQMAGLTAIESSEILGISVRQIENYRADMSTYIGTAIDVSALRRGVYALLPEALGSMKDLLKDRDSPATIAFFKGLGLFIDKSEVKSDADGSRHKPTKQLDAEIVEIINESEGPDRESDAGEASTG